MSTVFNNINSGVMNNTFQGTGNITNNVSGSMNNNYFGSNPVTNNIGTITGNFVNMSFFFDQYTLVTGLEQFEVFVGRNFTFTGYAIGAINSAGAGAFSGSFYQRNTSNTKASFVNFGMPVGQFFSGRGGFNQTISGMNRVGVDILTLGTGITGLSLGLFGFGT